MYQKSTKASGLTSSVPATIECDLHANESSGIPLSTSHQYT